MKFHAETSESTILWHRPTQAYAQANFPKYTQFCKLSALGLGQKPTHRYTKYEEKTPLSL